MTFPASPVPATAVDPARLHAAFCRAFADYVGGSFDLAASEWPGFLHRQGVSLEASRVVLYEGEPIAFAFVAPRPALRRWRLATMGAVPQARGRGVADTLMADLLARAAAAGMAAAELEVFAQNERASRLYARHGFEPRWPLHGHAATAAAAAAETGDAPAPTTVDAAAAQAWLAQAEARLPDLPLQVSAQALATAPPGWRAWQRGSAQLVWSGDGSGTVQVRSLVDLDPAQHDAEALVRALAACQTGGTLVVPPLQRPDLGGDALERAGWVRQPLWQWLMVRPLGPASAGAATGDG